jgi:hypothetical protein
MAQLRYVKERISTARFKLFVCHEFDVSVTFDVTGIPRELALLQIAHWMGHHQPNTEYRVQRSKMRPGYAFVHYVIGER